MSLPFGPMIRFTFVLGCAGLLAACGDADSGNSGRSSGMSRELVNGQDKSLLHVAEAARDGGDCASAIRIYRSMVQSGDRSDTVHVGLGDCLFLTGAYTEATVEYHEVDEHSPKIADAEIGLGRIFLAQHKAGDADVQFEGALKLLPADKRALNGAGVALDNLNRHAEAQVYYQRALAIAPDDRVIRNNYGLSLALSGNYAEAIAVLRPLVSEPGSTARNRQNLAMALALSGARSEATKVAEVDLDTASVNANLRFYDALRSTPAPAERAAASAPPAPPAVVAPAPVIAAPPPVPIAVAAPPAAAPQVAALPPPPPTVLQPEPTPPAQIPAAAPPAPAALAPAPAAVAPPTVLAPEAAPPQAETRAPETRMADTAPAGPHPAEARSNGQFGIQIAVYQKVSGIAPGWQKYKTGFADVVGSLEPRVAMVDLGDGRGPLYRLKIGPFHSATAAQAACQRLKAEGSDCKVGDFDGAPAQEYWKEHQIE